MLGCTGDFNNKDADPETSEQDLYIHGYVSGRIFKSGKDSEGNGLPITVAASYAHPHLLLVNVRVNGAENANGNIATSTGSSLR